MPRRVITMLVFGLSLALVLSGLSIALAQPFSQNADAVGIHQLPITPMLKSESECPVGHEPLNELCAQWVAATAAREATSVAWTALYWNVASLFALVLTLGATAWSSWSAGKAANAAEKSVELTRLTSQRQLRAYICPDEVASPVIVIDGKLMLAFSVLWKNCGMTPAVKVITWCVAATFTGDITQMQPKTALDYSGLGVLTGPNQTIRAFLKPVDLGTLARELKSGHNFIVWVAIEYNDAFNIRRRTEASYIADLIGDKLEFRHGPYHFAMDDDCIHPPKQPQAA